MKLYTPQEYIKEMGIHRSTLQKWVREGKLKGLVPNGKSYLIPEENLSLPVHRKRKSKKRPILTEIQAREAYEKAIGSRNNKLKFTYDELRIMFDEGKTLDSIALEAGVTKARIGQVYNQFFAFGVNGYERRSAIRLEIAIDRERQAILDGERMAHLGREAVERGLSLKPIQMGKGPSFHRYAVEINGHSCKVHFSRKDTKFVGTHYRSYSRILLTGHFLDSYEFIVAITGEEDKRRIFIIPTGDLRGLFRKSDHRKPIYLPTSEKPVYNNVHPLIDWWKYHEAWHLLERSA